MPSKQEHGPVSAKREAHATRRRSGATRGWRYRRHHPPGTPPGTLIADPAASMPVIEITGYGPDAQVREKVSSVDEIQGYVDRFPNVWVDVRGLGDADIIARLGDQFGLHRLALEDVLQTGQRPKLETYDSNIFIVLRRPEEGPQFLTEQISLFLGRNFIITCQEHAGDCFDPVRARLADSGGRLRAHSADYLAYALIDAVIDAYFPALEAFGERVDALEQSVFATDADFLIEDIHDLKRDLLLVRRALWPHRDLVNNLIRDEHELVSQQTTIFLRDCYEHLIQLMDITETYREIASSLVDIYLSRQSQRMNEVMKVLTVIATIFMPLSFIAGVYGMNFERAVSPWNMPELGWYLGYPYALAVMATIGGGMLFFFWRRGWMWRRRGARKDRDRL